MIIVCFLVQSHRKTKDSLEGSLERVLFAAELEFPKIIVPRLTQNTSNINIECVGKSKQLYSLCDQLLVPLISIHLIVLILICLQVIMSGVYNYAICYCSSSRPSPGITLHRSNTGGKTLLQLLLKIG